jgi:hypothetical protein
MGVVNISPVALTLRKDPGAHWIGGLVGLSQSRPFGVGKKFVTGARILVRNGEKLSFMYLNVVSQRSVQRPEEDHGDLKSGYPFRRTEKNFFSEDELRASLMYQFIRK